MYILLCTRLFCKLMSIPILLSFHFSDMLLVNTSNYKQNPSFLSIWGINYGNTFLSDVKNTKAKKFVSSVYEMEIRLTKMASHSSALIYI